MTFPPDLATERLLLRPPHADDAAAVLVFRGDPVVQRFDDPPIRTLDESRNFIEELWHGMGEERLDAWVAVPTGSAEAIGLVTLQFRPGDRHHRRAEIGYGFARAWWGRGYGSEAVRAVVRHAFDTLDLHRVYAHTIAENHESIRMLERIGFIREGVLREHSWEEDYGRFLDSLIYGRLRTDPAPG